LSGAEKVAFAAPMCMLMGITLHFIKMYDYKLNQEVHLMCNIVIMIIMVISFNKYYSKNNDLWLLINVFFYNHFEIIFIMIILRSKVIK